MHRSGPLIAPPSLAAVRSWAEQHHDGQGGANGKSALRHAALVSCANRVQLRHVPFYSPCLIVVLAGIKTIYTPEPVRARAGQVLALPPGSFDLQNEPGENGHYRALIIPFASKHMEHARNACGARSAPTRHVDPAVLAFTADETLFGCLQHYLDGPEETRLLDHRLTELLMVLGLKDERLWAFALAEDRWAPRVRAVLAADLAHPWSVDEVARLLATSERTLRRHLAAENTNFRALMQDLRLSNALMRLLQSGHPVSEIAFDCGYQSLSRFTSSFKRRFGAPPTVIRASGDENGYKLAACEQSALP